MASKRKLKKDVNYIAYELLTEYFTIKHFHSDLNEEKFLEAVRNIVCKRNELISMINHPTLSDGENMRKYHNKIRKELSAFASLVEKINIQDVS